MVVHPSVAASILTCTNECQSTREDSVTAATMRQLGRVCVGIAILIIVVALLGMAGVIPRLTRTNGVIITALLFSVVGRNLQRRAARMSRP